MEKTIRNILRKLDKKKICIETETVEGGCIAVPAFIISGKHNGKDIMSKSIEIEDALEDFFEQIS